LSDFGLLSNSPPHHFYIQATGTLVAALADDEDSRAAAEQLYEAAMCFLNSVKNIVFVDE